MDQFEAELDRATAAKTVPGVVVAAADKTGETIYTYTSGRQSLEPDAPPISLDSIFGVQSCTKLVAAVAALQCVERGLIGLDEDVAPHLPELDALEIISIQPSDSAQGPAEDATATDAPPAPRFTYTPAKEKITLRHLLSHTSGVGVDYKGPLVAWRASRGEPVKFNNGDVVASCAFPRVHEAGARWMYGTGCDWAGLLVGRLNGTTFGGYLDANLFGPLGMRDSTFHLEERPDVRARLVEMSLRREDRSFTKGEHELPDPALGEMGGGGLYTSGGDFARLLADLVKEEPTMLRRETVELLFAPSLERGGVAHEAMREYEPYWNAFMPGPLEGMNWGVGGLLVMEDHPVASVPKGTVTWSGSSGPMWALNREKGFAWFFATHASYGDTESGELCQKFSKLVFAGKARR